MLTPAMRAIFLLALPLLVPRVLADHEDPAVPADDLALLAHRLDRRSYLHDPFRSLRPDDPDGEALETGAAAATIPRSGLLHADGPLDLSATGEYSAVFRAFAATQRRMRWRLESACPRRFRGSRGSRCSSGRGARRRVGSPPSGPSIASSIPIMSR